MKENHQGFQDNSNFFIIRNKRKPRWINRWVGGRTEGEIYRGENPSGKTGMKTPSGERHKGKDGEKQTGYKDRGGVGKTGVGKDRWGKHRWEKAEREIT